MNNDSQSALRFVLFATSVADAWMALMAMAGFDADDPWSRRITIAPLGALPPALRIGVPPASQREFLGDRQAEAAYDAHLRALTLSTELVEIDIAPFLETARLLRRWVASHTALAGNRRSILFAAFGAEEEGLLGSSNLASELGTPMDSVVAMVNLDMVGRLRGNTLPVEGAGTAPEWPALLADANADGLAFQFMDDYVSRNDQYPFIQRGIPAIHLFPGLHPEYHTPADDVELLNTAGAAASARSLPAPTGWMSWASRFARESSMASTP